MGLLFRLSVVVFVYLVFGLAMFWLSVGIVGKKVKAVPFLLYTACSGVANFLAVYSVAGLYTGETLWSYIIDLAYSLVIYSIEAAALGLVIRKCYKIPFLHGMTAAMLSH